MRRLTSLWKAGRIASGGVPQSPPPVVPWRPAFLFASVARAGCLSTAVAGHPTRCPYPVTVARWIGTALVLAGALVLAVDLDHGDTVVVDLTASHGVHLSDALGLVAILVGLVLLLVRARDDRHGGRSSG